MSSSDITFAPPSAGPDTASGSNNSGEVQISTTAHPAAPATNNGQGEATVDSEDGLQTTKVVRRRSRSPSSASHVGAQSGRDAASQSKRSASSGSRRSAFTSRGETGVMEINIHNPLGPACTSRGATDNNTTNDPACTSRGATDNNAINDPACTSRGTTGRDSSEIPVSRDQDDPELMLDEMIRKHLSEAGRSEPERSQGDASDRSVKSRTSSRVHKRFVPLTDVLGQAKPKSPRAIEHGLNLPGFDV